MSASPSNVVLLFEQARTIRPSHWGRLLTAGLGCLVHPVLWQLGRKAGLDRGAKVGTFRGGLFRHVAASDLHSPS